MDVLTLAIPRATPTSMLSQGAVLEQRPTKIAISSSSLLRFGSS